MGVFFFADELFGKFSQSSGAKKKNPKLRRREKMNFRRSFPNIRQLKQNPKKSPFFFIHPLGFFQPPCIIMKRLYITICIKQFNNYVNNIKGHQPNSQKCYFIEEHDIFGYHSCQYGYVRYYFFHYHSLKFLIPFRNIFSGEKNNPMRKQRMSKSRKNSIFLFVLQSFFLLDTLDCARLFPVRNLWKNETQYKNEYSFVKDNKKIATVIDLCYRVSDR